MTDSTPKSNVLPHPALSNPQVNGRVTKSGGGGEPPMEIVERIIKIEADIIRLESKLESSFSKQETQFAQLTAKLDVGFAKVDSRFSDVETKIAQTESSFFKWAISFVLAIIGTTFAIVRFASDFPPHQAAATQPVTQIAPIVIPVPTQTTPINTESPQNTKPPIKQRH